MRGDGSCLYPELPLHFIPTFLTYTGGVRKSTTGIPQRMTEPDLGTRVFVNFCFSSSWYGTTEAHMATSCGDEVRSNMRRKSGR